ncbi:MAG TPA: hypothetical protein VN767_23810 [Streptosporangiaceae bacterium]|jgi:uncharacterized membrane protein YphA (DoxX/SURF4 family)|nr:hypothetical protein [Streptosporangiaceae bacterium]
MLRLKARDIPGRIVTGGYILHSGLEKWQGDEERAKAIHGMAANAFPFLKDIPPAQFLRMLAAGEIAVGGALLLPIVPAALAGTALTGFSGALMAMYARTPAMRKPGSIWPSRAGMAVSKDIWMVGIGLGLMLSDRKDSSASPNQADARVPSRTSGERRARR